MKAEILLITDEKIIVSLNDEVIEIENNAEILKQECDSRNTKEIKIAEKIYNIGSIENATFKSSPELKSKKINAIITKKIIGEIAKYNIEAKEFLDGYPVTAAWENDDNISGDAKKIITKNILGIIGIKLERLFSIGSLMTSNPKNIDNYIKVCIEIYESTLDILNNILIARLWSEKKSNFKLNIAENLKNEVKNNLQRWNPPINYLEVKLNLFKSLIKDWPTQLQIYPSELNSFDKKTIERLTETSKAINTIYNNKNRINITLKSCEIAENKIADFLTEFGFLANYGMASFKDIKLKQIRTSTTNYVHNYLKVGIADYNKKDEFRYSEEKNPTATVVIFNGNKYFNSLSLFPFIIDYNAITKEENINICLFKRSRTTPNEGGKNIKEIEYYSIHKDKKEEVIKENGGEFNWNIHLSEDENHKQYYFHCIEQELNDIQKNL